MSTFAGIGKLEIAPLGTWIDLTAANLVRTEDTPISITRGRQTELDSVQSSQLTAVLDNSDGRFTPGNTAGPYGSAFTVGCPVRYSETIGERTFTLFTGTLAYPDVPSWQPIGYQDVQLSAVDLLTALSRESPFVSTLGAHIVNNATALGVTAYWPLVGSNGLNPYSIGAALQVPLTTGQSPAIGTSFFSVAGGSPVTADDAATLRLLPNIASGSEVSDIWLSGPYNPITLSSSTLTLSIWVFYEDVAPTAALFFQIDDGVALANLMNLQRNPTWSFGAALNNGLQNVSAACNPLPSWKWNLLTLRMTLPSGLVEMWMNDAPAVSGTLSGTPPSSVTFTSFTMGEGIQGNLAHLQVYLGTQFTRAAHLAQYQMGLTGLEYQTTGQRVNTILDYAGVPSGLRVVDTGQSFMSVAKLSGQSAGQSLQDAVDTERARAFVDGQGRYVFQDRAHTLNV